MKPGWNSGVTAGRYAGPERSTVVREDTSMNRTENALIPPPKDVREQLARKLRVNRLLRALLRVSERAAEERRKDTPTPRPGREEVVSS